MDRRAAAIETLQQKLGYVFKNSELLELALTHASAGGGHGGPGRAVRNNERLEFLGDRVLGLAIADVLLELDPQAEAGDLTKRFGNLVNRTACARVARTLGLGTALRMTGGETRHGARENDTILADACEALIAAVHLEAGYDVAAERVVALWAPLLAEPIDLAVANPKTALQEWAAASGLPPPAYRVVLRTGPAHRPHFVVEVTVGEGPGARGEGSSLRAAQKAGALALLAERGVLA